MGDAPIQLTREELSDMLAEASANAVKAAQRASIKRKLSEHVQAVEKQYVTPDVPLEEACVRASLDRSPLSPPTNNSFSRAQPVPEIRAHNFFQGRSRCQKSEL